MTLAIVLTIVALGPLALVSYGPTYQTIVGVASAAGSSNLSVEISYQEERGPANSSTSGFPVQFGAVISGGSAPYSESWAFGDGTGGSGPVVVHVSSTTGVWCFNGTLRVVDTAGNNGAQAFQVNERTGGVSAGTPMNGSRMAPCSGGGLGPSSSSGGSAGPSTSGYSLSFPYSAGWGKPGGWTPCNGHSSAYSNTQTSWGGIGGEPYSESDQSSCTSNTGDQNDNNGFWYCATGTGNSVTCPTAWKSGISSYTLSSNFTFEPFCFGGCQNDYINTVVSQYSGGGCHGHSLNYGYFTSAVWDLTSNSNVLFTSQSMAGSANNSYSYGCSGGYQGLPHPGGPNDAWINYSISGSFSAAHGDSLIPRAGFVATSYSSDNNSGCLFGCTGYAKSLVGYDESCFVWGGYTGCSGVLVLASFWLR